MSQNTLCLDFGNTRNKAAIFNEQGELLEVIDFNGQPELITIEDLIQNHSIRYSILSSVIKHNPEIEKLLASLTKFHLLSYKTKLPFTSPVGKPETIGADRLAIAAAAVHFYPGKNILVVALGSCITYNFINKYKEFIGGSISPGKNMRFRAMNEFTAALPLAKSNFYQPLVGYDTNTNLQSGVMYGMTAEIEGIIAKYDERYGNFNVVLTGGDTAYFATQLKYRIFADFNFLFKGLYALSLLNNKEL